MGVLNQIEETLDKTDRHETWRTISIWLAGIIITMAQYYMVSTLSEIRAEMKTTNNQVREQAVLIARVTQQITYLEQKSGEFQAWKEKGDRFTRQDGEALKREVEALRNKR